MRDRIHVIRVPSHPHPVLSIHMDGAVARRPAGYLHRPPPEVKGADGAAGVVVHHAFHDVVGAEPCVNSLINAFRYLNPIVLKLKRRCMELRPHSRQNPILLLLGEQPQACGGSELDPCCLSDCLGDVVEREVQERLDRVGGLLGVVCVAREAGFDLEIIVVGDVGQRLAPPHPPVQVHSGPGGPSVDHEAVLDREALLGVPLVVFRLGRHRHGAQENVDGRHSAERVLSIASCDHGTSRRFRFSGARGATLQPMAARMDLI
mmetsp:Transcript_24189/g.46861  ORF Transcript_24189/g.46861 Transcript_24189/m.46861 type:complete len:262 (-) Transcript_24189:43-828(-)